MTAGLSNEGHEEERREEREEKCIGLKVLLAILIATKMRKPHCVMGSAVRHVSVDKPR